MAWHPPPRWSKRSSEEAMSWPEFPMQSPFHSIARRRPSMPRVENEPQYDEKLEDCPVSISMLARYPESTHFGRLASVFSDRMPCTGMYGLPSLPQDNPFAITQNMDSAPGLPSLEVSDSVASHYNSTSSIDMQQFEESSDVDLQQLFPSHAPMAFLPASLTSAGHSSVTDTRFLSHSTHQPSLPSAHGLDGTSDQFAEAYPPLPASDASATMLLPFAFSSTSASFDDGDGLATEAPRKQETNDMQEITHLFNNNAVVMTPPTVVTIPRTTIVSPIASLGSQRSAPLVVTARGESKKTSLRQLQDNVVPRFTIDRRKLCDVEGCRSQARAFNRCKRHGGSKRCSMAGCTKSVQSRGLCIRHGGGSRCQDDGCTRAAQSHGKCKMHGGGRPCIMDGCDKKAHLKRLCRKHGGGSKCSVAECEKWAQRQGMCMTHAKQQSLLDESPPPAPLAPSWTQPATQLTERMEV